METPFVAPGPNRHARASVAKERCRCMGSAVSPEFAKDFSSENSQFWTQEVNAICRENSAICSESVRSVGSSKKLVISEIVLPFLFF